MSTRFPLAAVLVTVLVIQLFSGMAGRRIRVSGGAVPTELNIMDTVSMQIRRAIANILWIRVDDYLHSSDLVVPETAAKAGSTEVRGVSPAMSGPELVPLARLVTTLDPTFVTAGMVLGGTLLSQSKDKRAAIDLLLTLIKANPDHPRLFMLYYTAGNARWEAGDHKGARPFLERAVELYPRVLDPRRLLRAGEPPLSGTDQFILKGALARLVKSMVILEDYEAGLKYWLKSEGFDPKNKVIRVLAMYMAQKRQNKVDKDELALYYQKLSREEQEQSFKAAEEAAKKRGSKLPDKDEDGASNPQRELLRKPQTALIIDLGLPPMQARKLGAVLSAMVILLLIGRWRGWLNR